MYLSPEEKAVGQGNFQNAIGVTRRDFLKTGIAAGAVSGAGLGAMYFGYEAAVSNPLRVGFIGTGDEGNVLLGAITPSYINVVAIADIRPYNVHRAFHGDHSSENALKVRSGLMTKYGWATEDEARKHVKVYDQDYHDLLKDPDVEAVVIALPLHLHAPVAIEAMKAGKHVLTEKLMGHSVHECKEMARFAQQSNKILATGHQRHYSILYDNAVDTIRRGLIGEIHSIRAQWHRDNLPGHDSWSLPLPDDKMGQRVARLSKELEGAKGLAIDKLGKEITKLVSLKREIEAARTNTVDTISHDLDQLTLQYLEYVEMMRSKQLELAAEYLLMAAMLIEIKSRMLLPRPSSTDMEEDPRAELVRRLLEYEQMKAAAHRLNELPQAGRDYSLIHVLFERDAAGLEAFEHGRRNHFRLYRDGR